jgi:hypothetical protein
MSKFEFVLVGCLDVTVCQFTRADIPEATA